MTHLPNRGDQGLQLRYLTHSVVNQMHRSGLLLNNYKIPPRPIDRASAHFPMMQNSDDTFIHFHVA